MRKGNIQIIVRLNEKRRKLYLLGLKKPDFHKLLLFVY